MIRFRKAYDTTFKKNANESGDPIVKCKAVNTEAASVLKLICIVKLVQRHASSNDKKERGGERYRNIFSVFKVYLSLILQRTTKRYCIQTLKNELSVSEISQFIFHFF